MSLAGKVAIVTGAAQGLGKAFVKALLTAGVRVCMTDINDKEGQNTFKEYEAEFGENTVTFIKTDVTSHEQMKETFEKTVQKYGQLDIVVNNAGIGGEVYPLWERVVDINLKGVISGTMLAIEHLRRDKGGNGGVIVNISSMAGLNPNPFGPVYCATKHAIVGFTRSYALNADCVQNGVRVNVLCPAFADTHLVSGLQDENCLNLTQAKNFVKTCGIMTTDYVAEGLMELIEDETKNGAILKMSKGFGKAYHST